jgi:hypothetical protein
MKSLGSRYMIARFRMMWMHRICTVWDLREVILTTGRRTTMHHLDENGAVTLLIVGWEGYVNGDCEM